MPWNSLIHPSADTASWARAVFTNHVVVLSRPGVRTEGQRGASSQRSYWNRRKAELSQHICPRPIKMLSVEAPARDLSRAPTTGTSSSLRPRESCHLLTGTCFRKCHGEMWDPAVFQFAHIWKLLVTQLWEGVGRGPMISHTLHWKGF